MALPVIFVFQEKYHGMNIQEFDTRCRTLFDSFLTFYSGWNAGQLRNVEIKRQHSLRVSALCEKLAVALGLGPEEVALARAIGLVHDLGRFPQLMKYNTFNDAVSVDHAALAVEELERGNLLQGLEPGVAQTVKTAVLFHNKLALPAHLPEQERLFSQILRDADKLDILEVITDYYQNRDREPNHTLTWELPAKGISEKVLQMLREEKPVEREWVKTQEDIKLMQLSWVYDLNFKPSYRILSQNRYVDKIFSVLPKRDEVYEVYRQVRIYVENKFMN